MKGNEAIAEAALRAGCQAFFGYPITPQSEILEYLAREMPVRGGVILQAESEIAAMNMVMGASASGGRVMTSTSGPGFCLKLEALSVMTLTRLPAVIVLIQRSGPGFGTMKASQEDYRMNGSGGYRTVILAPSTIQEAADMTFEAFDIADQYRNPVIVMGDAIIGQMMEGVDFDRMPAPRENLPEKEWALHGSSARGGKPYFHYVAEGRTHYEEKYYAETELYPTIIRNETRVEIVDVENADIVLTAYGTAARMCRSIMALGVENIKLGLIRPKTLWPFPYEAFDRIGSECKAVLCPEINTIGQMIDDVRIAAKGRWPVVHVGDTAEDFLQPQGIEHAVKTLWEELRNK